MRKEWQEQNKILLYRNTATFIQSKVKKESYWVRECQKRKKKEGKGEGRNEFEEINDVKNCCITFIIEGDHEGSGQG